MRIRNSLTVAISFTIAGAIGCRMSVPIHTWKPAELESTVGKRVVLADVVGPAEIAADLQQRMLAAVPREPGRQTSLLLTSNLHNEREIQLTAGSDAETSDIALASVARREGYDYVLRGEVVNSTRPYFTENQPDRLSVSWRLFALGDQRSAGGAPVVVDKETAIERYPDLGLLVDEDQILNTALVRDTYRLITPSVTRDQARLGNPYLLPGSQDVRRGNLAAARGMWHQAQEIWSEVAESHPSQVAAIHNLALAAAAEQDFSRARELARQAIRKQPTRLHKETLVWIETRQRDYHQAFNLPDPPEGWFVTSR
jgi:tetratricopeptide (TPR) repeat protein